jgi:hypothetical protein
VLHSEMFHSERQYQNVYHMSWGIKFAMATEPKTQPSTTHQTGFAADKLPAWLDFNQSFPPATVPGGWRRLPRCARTRRAKPTVDIIDHRRLVGTIGPPRPTRASCCSASRTISNRANLSARRPRPRHCRDSTTSRGRHPFRRSGGPRRPPPLQRRLQFRPV